MLNLKSALVAIILATTASVAVASPTATFQELEKNHAAYLLNKGGMTGYEVTGKYDNSKPMPLVEQVNRELLLKRSSSKQRAENEYHKERSMKVKSFSENLAHKVKDRAVKSAENVKTIFMPFN